MKKIMLADLMKDVVDSYLEERALRIKELLDQFNITESDAAKIVDNYSNEDTQYLIAKAMEDYDLDLGEAEMFVDDHPNESEWADYEAAAESLGVDITDLDDDDVENYMSMGGNNKGEIESSVGTIQWLYDNKAKIYAVYILTGSDNGLMYNVSPEIMSDWSNAESAGEYWNEYIRSNEEVEDSANSEEFPIGGCKPNPVDPQTVARFNTRFVAIS
jgi:hypothetical protein